MALGIRAAMALQLHQRGGGGSGGGSDLVASDIVNLSNFDGVDEATAYTEESGDAQVYTFGSGAKLDSAQVKFGTTALKTGGGNGVAHCPISIDRSKDGFSMGWFRASAQSITSNANGRQFAIPGTLQIWESTTNSASVHVQVDGNTTLFATLPGGTASETNTFHHYQLELTHATKALKLWYDGALLIDGTLSSSGMTATPGTTLYIGNITSVAGFASDWEGWVDGLRISDGVEGLGGTVPTEAPTLNFDEARS